MAFTILVFHYSIILQPKSFVNPSLLVTKTPWLFAHRCAICYNQIMKYNKDYFKNWRNTPSGIWSTTYTHHGRKNKRGFLISKDEFLTWYKKQDKKCHYCLIDESELSRIIQFRSKTKRLTIDRTDNSKPYALENIVLACHRCNTIKGGTFTEEEMTEIGKKYLVGRR